MSGTSGDEHEQQADSRRYVGDHIELPDGDFHDQVIGKQENHHHDHHYYPAPPAGPSGDQAPPGVPLSQVQDPFQFEVHRPFDLPHEGLPPLPPYISREHDRRLRDVVLAAAEGSVSRIAVLVGGSSTGKTRACWQALEVLRDRPEPWRVWHPIDPGRPGAAVARLRQVAPYTVVWLNEAQFYLAPDQLGEQVASGLRELLRDTRRGPVLVLATLWPQYWDALTTRPEAGAPDPHAQARELLTGHMIAVPDAFTRPDLQAMTDRAKGDPRLAEASEHAADGQITQYLAGAPVLLDRYTQASPVTKALITAAMDARRLGAGPHLPLVWLSEAAPGYLTDTQWQQTGQDWLQQALDYAATPCNGIPGILAPIKTGTPRNRRNRRATPPAAAPAPPANGVLYRLADYLDQYGRHHRAGHIPPIDFWTAAARHAHPADLTALGQEARDRGLYRDAAQLLKHATTHGYPGAAALLLRLMHFTHPTDNRPARIAAAHLPLDTPYAVVRLLEAFWEAGAVEQIAGLAERSVVHVALDNPREVARLLEVLRGVGAVEQIAALLEREPAMHVALDDPYGVARLLEVLRGVGAVEQIAALAGRAVAHVALDDLYAVARLLVVLRQVGAVEQFTALAGRAVAHVALDDLYAVASLLEALWEAGAVEQVAALLERDPVTHVPLDDPDAVASLLEALWEAGAVDQVAALLERDPLVHVDLDDPGPVAGLLEALREVGAVEQAAALAGHAVAHVALNDPDDVASLLEALRWNGAADQVAALLERDPARHVALDDPDDVASLLEALRWVGAADQVAALLERDPARHVALDDPDDVASLLQVLRWDGAADQVAALLERDPARHVALDDPDAVAYLLEVLRGIGAVEQVAKLAGRVVVHVALDGPRGVARLLQVLRGTGAVKQVAALAERFPAAGLFDQFLEFGDHRHKYRFGREPDGRAADPWDWDDLD
ncbi:hypothetical protein [Nonomuraea sp. NPDC050310]|uniref:hypothetical protein n=1 Tax=Nonomuraea sp. NPDC050310 TaxID=3154935 RepID=UPI003403E952